MSRSKKALARNKPSRTGLWALALPDLVPEQEGASIPLSEECYAPGSDVCLS